MHCKSFAPDTWRSQAQSSGIAQECHDAYPQLWNWSHPTLDSWKNSDVDALQHAVRADSLYLPCHAAPVGRRPLRPFPISGLTDTMRRDCTACAALRKERSIHNPVELDAAIKMVRNHLVDNAIRELETTALGAVPFASCYESPGYPDFIHNRFECNSCSLRFALVVETYHGSGGSWEIDPESVTGPA